MKGKGARAKDRIINSCRRREGEREVESLEANCGGQNGKTSCFFLKGRRGRFKGSSRPSKRKKKGNRGANITLGDHQDVTWIGNLREVLYIEGGCERNPQAMGLETCPAGGEGRDRTRERLNRRS